MTTLVIHGTMPGVSSPTKAKWWWDSWHQGGFLYHLSNGIMKMSGTHRDDVWKIKGKRVSEIPDIVENSQDRRMKKLKGQERFFVAMGTQEFPETYSAHKGHYMWTGSFSNVLREQGGRTLARYLNQISKIAPEEPIRIVGHSHGCNVLKMASSSELLDPSVYIQRAIFLACPHFRIQVLGKSKYPYNLEPERFGEIFNIFSPMDKVQVDIAEDLPGPPDNFDFAGWPVSSHRTEQNPAIQGGIHNFEIPTVDEGIKAHTAIHGQTVATFCASLLECETREVDSAYDSFKATSTPIPAGDFGE